MYVTDVCVLVPVFNESGVIGRTVTDLRSIFDHVVCVDDGSTDGSAEVALASGAVVLRHAVNQGQGAALETGFEYIRRATTARHVITFDADGQHSVDDAVRMLERARTTGVDVVLGTRFCGRRAEIPRVRRRVLRAAVWFTRLTSRLDVTDTHNGLRVLSRSAVLAIRLELPRSAHASELLSVIARGGLSYAEEPVTITYTDYSIAKGQRNSNSLNVLFDLAMRRLRSAP
jgi:glycosyltransferase involved in cell wall biosynthesis